MARYRTTIDSAWPAEAAFVYFADFASAQQWDPGVRSAVRTAGEAGQRGAVYRLAVGFFGRTLDLDYHILESCAPTADQPGRVVLEAVSPQFTSHDVITVAPMAVGCQVTYDADLRLHGWQRVLDPGLWALFQVVGRRADHGMRAALQGTQAATA